MFYDPGIQALHPPPLLPTEIFILKSRLNLADHMSGW
jgi:hypothetical protein